jgi:predicted TIM-barrel fold metal-dependent hydrolase
LNGLKQAMERSFQQSQQIGMVTVKTTIAYGRELLFREVEEGDAARDFDVLMEDGRRLPRGFRRYTERPFRNLEDHMFHHLMSLADAHNVPVQVHTGLQAGNGNYISNSNPTLLTNLFFLHPRVRFDLFHISYPYQEELSVLAKMFPNVYVDFCWAYIISPSVSRRTLHEFLETIPVNKIFGFGGDYRYPEFSYAHLKMAKRDIARVLAEKTESGFCSEDEAVEIGTMLLRDNASKLFSPASATGAAGPAG